jgi:hypothetical protein
MKIVSMAKVLGIGLALLFAGSQARAVQWTGGNSTQPQGSWTDSTPTFGGRGNAFGGQTLQQAQFEQPGRSFVQGQPTATRYGSSMAHGIAFDHNRSHFRGHRHFIVVFVNGLPCWFPVYTDYPYGYDVPVDTSSSTVSDTSSDGYVPAANSNDADSGSSPETSAYSDLGLSWGQDLRREVATWNQFVDYLREYVINAPASSQADFREAFIGAYRLNGASAYDKAAAQAAGLPPTPAPGPKIITFPPPPSPSGS